MEQQDLNVNRIINQETDDFFEENSDNVFIKVINLDEYPVAYYTSENSLNTLSERDALSCFNAELTKKIKTVAREKSKRNFIIENFYFQYIMNHFGKDEEAMKIVIDNLFDADIVIIMYRYYMDQVGMFSETMRSFLTAIHEADHTILKKKRPLASIVKFQVEPLPIDKHSFKINEEYLRENYEFDMFNTFIKLGFIFVPDFFISILEQPSGNIIDAIRNSFIGESFTHMHQKQLYNKINDMISNIVTIKG